MKTYYLFLIGILHSIIPQKSYSQTKEGVGIGITSPDQSAILHIQPPSDNKGLLIPRLTENEMLNINDEAEGLIVYNTTAGALYHFVAGRWSMVGTPRGIISMWSGNEGSIPEGWALCDGRWYNPNDHTDKGTSSTTTRTVPTPDLRGRFIVGLDTEYDAANNDYDNAGNFSSGGSSASDVGGVENNTLTMSHIPSHNHEVNLTTSTDGIHSHDVNYTGATGKQVGSNAGSGEEGANDAALTTVTKEGGNHSHEVNGVTASSGATSPLAIENRPPYYVLAFIMKL